MTSVIALAPSPGAEGDDLAAGPVQPAAAGQAPGPADDRGAAEADPEPGRVHPAADADLDGARRAGDDGAHGGDLLRCGAPAARTRPAALAATAATAWSTSAGVL